MVVASSKRSVKIWKTNAKRLGPALDNQEIFELFEQFYQTWRARLFYIDPQRDTGFARENGNVRSLESVDCHYHIPNKRFRDLRPWSLPIKQVSDSGLYTLCSDPFLCSNTTKVVVPNSRNTPFKSASTNQHHNSMKALHPQRSHLYASRF